MPYLLFLYYSPGSETNSLDFHMAKALGIICAYLLQDEFRHFSPVGTLHDGIMLKATFFFCQLHPCRINQNTWLFSLKIDILLTDTSYIVQIYSFLRGSLKFHHQTHNIMSNRSLPRGCLRRSLPEVDSLLPLWCSGRSNFPMYSTEKNSTLESYLTDIFKKSEKHLNVFEA